ncbi:adenine nucleotide alpha hydrolase [Xanthobacteraceae bacterium Astr-EGSB]|uniref:adenine nucleotide alpha hydrolase n=1 Tax=Astrobacterium formosum TaxID=3069710 RepID=UPI0027B8291E|nr:adenine nucleotide alpha hydrolase [Xanthobacteraceae bacterium Astr-EGSB]
MLQKLQADLVAALDSHDALAVAVSGGVDSMVLAYIAHHFARVDVTAVHALSPAVPAAATARVKDYAARHGWTLRLIDAGELSDPVYRSNPVDRCFYCKTNLYSRIRAVTGLPIASGTNRDDLTDYRPGLKAARDHNVVHPFVDAGIGKSEIYSLAKKHGLADLAELPAQPCLASRIETGIIVDASALRFIEEAEKTLCELLPDAKDIRCRITAAGVYVECTPLPVGDGRVRAEHRVSGLCMAAGRRFAGMREYHRGAAFLRGVAR